MSAVENSHLDDVRKAYVALSESYAPVHLKEVRSRMAPIEFDELCADPRVRFVAVKRADIIIGTHPLTMRVTKNPNLGLRLLGEMILVIGADSRNIHCENVSHPVASAFSRLKIKEFYPHPHIHPSGVPCFGSKPPVHLQTWFSDAKYVHIAFMMLDFFGHAQGSDHYADAGPEKWPPYVSE